MSGMLMLKGVTVTVGVESLGLGKSKIRRKGGGVGDDERSVSDVERGLTGGERCFCVWFSVMEIKGRRRS